MTLEQVTRLFEGYPNYSLPIAQEVAKSIFNSFSGEFYGGFVSQNLTDPPEWTNLKNTIGNIVWTRVANGAYRGTLVGAFANKKVQCKGSFFQSDFDSSRVAINIQKESNNTILLTGYDISNQSNNLDSLMTSVYIEFSLVDIT